MQGQSTSENVVTWFITLMDTEEPSHGINIHRKGFGNVQNLFEFFKKTL